MTISQLRECVEHATDFRELRECFLALCRILEGTEPSKTEPCDDSYYESLMTWFWSFYPHRNGVKIGKATTLGLMRKYVKRNEFELLRKSVENFKSIVIDGIGIPDPERFIYSAKKKCEPWREWAVMEKSEVTNGLQKSGQRRNYGAERDNERRKNIEQATSRLCPSAESTIKATSPIPYDSERGRDGCLARGLSEDSTLEVIQDR